MLELAITDVGKSTGQEIPTYEPKQILECDIDSPIYTLNQTQTLAAKTSMSTKGNQPAR